MRLANRLYLQAFIDEAVEQALTVWKAVQNQHAAGITGKVDAVISRNQWAVIGDMRNEPDPPLADIIARLNPCDLVVVEGYKRDGHPKIEARNLELDHPTLAGEDETVIAIAASGPIEDAAVPVFDRNDIVAIAGFIAQYLEREAS